jgi:hypothetical protein
MCAYETPSLLAIATSVVHVFLFKKCLSNAQLARGFEPSGLLDLGSLLNVHAIRKRLLDLLTGEPDSMTFQLEKRKIFEALPNITCVSN